MVFSILAVDLQREGGGRRQTGLFRNVEHCGSSQHVETTSTPTVATESTRNNPDPGMQSIFRLAARRPPAESGKTCHRAGERKMDWTEPPP